MSLSKVMHDSAVPDSNLFSSGYFHLFEFGSRLLQGVNMNMCYAQQMPSLSCFPPHREAADATDLIHSFNIHGVMRDASI